MKRLTLVFTLALIVVFLTSCEKDEVLNQTIENSRQSSQIENGERFISGDYSEFEEAFQSQKSIQSQNLKNILNRDSMSIMNPLWYNLDMSSASYTDFFDLPAVLVNVSSSPFEYTPWMRNQVLIKEISNGIYEISTLLYIADNVYYTEKGYNPLLINFTGSVIEYSSTEEIANVYTLDLGVLINTDPDIQSLKKPKCPRFGDSFWERLGDWIRGIIGSGGGGGGSGIGGGSVGGFWGGGFGGGGTGGTHGTGESGGGGGGGGGSINNSPACQNQSIFWPQYDIMVKRNYQEALSRVLTNFNISACHDPFSTSEPCEITYSEILCRAEAFRCFATANPSENDFLECLTTMLTPMDEPPAVLPCQIAVDAFNNSYGTDFRALELAALLGGFGDLCGDQEAFDEAVMENLISDIIIIEEDLVDNEVFYCLILSQLFGTGRNSLFDNTIRAFQYSFAVNLHFDDIRNHPNSSSSLNSGVTLADWPNNKVTIYFDTNQSPIDMATTILHEGIHASILAYLHNSGVDVSLLNTRRLHELYALNRYGENDLHHYYMVETYIVPIASALRKLDGNQFPVEYYYGFAWDGLRWYATDTSSPAASSYNQYMSQVRNASTLCGQ